MSNEIDRGLFEQIFGHTLIKLADKLINTTNKEENQITVNSIRKNKYKLYEKDDFGDWVTQPSNQHINLWDAIDLILDFNEELSYIWFQRSSIENIKIKKVSGNFSLGKHSKLLITLSKY